jgi:hypothetical protein
MKRLLLSKFYLFLLISLASSVLLYSQCPNNDTTDTDNDGVLDCIDPCPNVANSIAGNLSFEFDLIGWNIPQNQSNFNISTDINNTLNGNKSLVVTAPNNSTFEAFAIESEPFTLQPNIGYDLRIPAKRLSSNDGDAIRWVLIDSDGVYRHFNNYYNTTENWTTINISNLVIDFSNYTSNTFRLRLEFGLSSVDMALDRIELYESAQGFDPTYQDLDGDGLPDCEIIDVSNHPDYDALVDLYNSTNGDNWLNNINWLDTSQPLSNWNGVILTNNRVTQILLGNNNLTGTLPNSINNLTQLERIDVLSNSIGGNVPQELGEISGLNWIDLRNNNFTGALSGNFSNLSNLFVFVISGNFIEGALPNFSNNVVANNGFLWLDNNKFQFGDFETEFDTYQTITNFIYTPQKQLDSKPNLLVNIGDQISINAEVSGLQNTYFWYKRNADNTSTVISNNEALDFTFSETDEGTYFLEVTNNTIPNLLLTSPDFQIGLDPTQSPDYAVLVDLYNSTNGANWTNNTNWLNPTVPLSGWHGISVENNKVTRILLANNNLTGSLPNSLLNLSNTESIFFNNNQLSGTLPDFSAISTLENLGLSNNDFSFLDFETNFTNNSNILNFNYSPQNQVDNEIIIDAVIGNDYNYTMTPIDGTNVQYQWYTISKVDLSDIDAVPGQSTNTLDLPNLQSDDMDAYICQATSTLVPGLNIQRRMVELKGAVSQAERNALIAFYNATDGQNWVNADNWNTAAPVSTWAGVTTTGNKVTSLARQSFNPNGQLPDDIGNLLNLEALYLGLGDLNLTGPIPETIGNLNGLKVFWIQGTGMSGEIPESFGNLVDLTEIRFLANKFTGVLPASLANLTELTSVIMTGNEFFGNRSSFSGPIPFNAPNATINIQENNFDFGDLEPFVQSGNYFSLAYSPQNTYDLAETVDSGVGSNITLNVNDTNLNRNNNTAMNNNFQWFKDNVAITGANAADYTIFNTQISDSGEYYCEITNSILPDLTIVRAPITLNIDPSLSTPIYIDNEISLYPNPAQNWITINTHNLVMAKISIYDIKGGLIMTQKLVNNLTAINIENLQSGIYIVQLMDDENVISKRIIKE